MIKHSLTIASAALCVALAGFGISRTFATSDDSPKSGKSKGSSTRKQSPEERMAEILAKLNLTPEQRAEWDATMEWMRVETIKMKQLGGGAMARGMEMNAEMKRRLRKAFGKATYDEYVYLSGFRDREAGWESPVSGLKEKEERILASLGLNDNQRAEIDALNVALARETEILNRLWNGSDSMAIGSQGGKINRMKTEGMKRILTPEQHKAYLEAWYGGVYRDPKPDGKFYSPARPMGRGSLGGGAAAAGGG